MPSADPPAALRVGPWLVSPQLNRLALGDQTVHLEPRAMDLLVCLATHPGEVVSKERLFQDVWHGQAVGDEALSNAIWELRRAFGDQARQPRFIETIHRKGYRLIAPVSAPADPRAARAAAEDTAASPAGPPGPPTPGLAPASSGTASGGEPAAGGWWRRPGRQALAGWLLLAVLAVAAVQLVWLVAGRSSGARGARPAGVVGADGPSQASIAVLPMVNLSGDPDQEYFSDGMTDELITRLAKIHSLTVISRTSVMRFKGAGLAVTEIGRQLNVRLVLEGSVLVVAARVRITAQLIDAATDRHVWAESYEGDLRDVLKLQGDVARAIADEIRAKLSPEEAAGVARARQVDPRAYRLYLQGQYHLNRRTSQEMHAALTDFERSLAIDPNFALAHVGRSLACNLLSFYGDLEPAAGLAVAESEALRALALEPDLPEGHMALGFVRHRAWDWQRTAAELERALAVAPGLATARHWYANNLAVLGRLEEAKAEIRRARDFDPLSATIETARGLIFYFARDYRSAAVSLAEAIDLQPDFWLAHLALGDVLIEQRQYPSAIAHMQIAVRASGDDPDAVAMLGYAYARAGRLVDARRILAEVTTAAAKRAHPGTLARLHAALGDRQAALRCLEDALASKDGWALFVKVDPQYDDLRGDPRLVQPLARAGLGGLGD